MFEEGKEVMTLNIEYINSKSTNLTEDDKDIMDNHQD